MPINTTAGERFQWTMLLAIAAGVTREPEEVHVK